MAFMTFDDALVTGVDFIDNDHRILVEQINILAELTVETERSETYQDTLASVLTTLADYTETHFAREEEVFGKVNYPRCEGHIQQHESFVERVKGAAAAFQAGTLAPDKLLTLLKAWLGAHIMKEDKVMAEFLLSRTNVVVPQLPGKIADLRVLVADEDFHFRTLLKTILRSLGITNVTEARDGGQALEIMKTMPIDAVLADARLKIIDGIEFTRFVRRDDGANPRSIIIVMPGSDITVAYVKDALDVGDRLTRHVTKPIPFVKQGKVWTLDRPSMPAQQKADGMRVAG